MATGQSGLSGRSAHGPVVRATEPGSGPAVALQLSTEGGHVRGRQRRSSCAVCDLVQVSKQSSFDSHRVSEQSIMHDEVGLSCNMYVCTMFLLLQWQVAGGPGYHGVHAVRPVVRVYSPESGCATTPLQRLMGRSVREQTPKHKCARKNRVLVRSQ